ncbi:hypothetical protein D927_00855 [Enterococcus faecalis 02-MB-BW-10]|nr:hypothetical protein D927_00855 [Enterococcus faecalis 02-MB-BW-10]
MLFHQVISCFSQKKIEIFQFRQLFVKKIRLQEPVFTTMVPEASS